MSGPPVEINKLTTINVSTPDHVFILAASWEERCLGTARIIGQYSCDKAILITYDTPSQLREKHIKELIELLSPLGKLDRIVANRSNPLESVRDTVKVVRKIVGDQAPRISIDISTFTRKHLLQLLQGLDLAGMLSNCQFFYTEQSDYHTHDDEPTTQGISSVKAIETFAGQNKPSCDSVLILFLGYEGRRAQSLWEHLEPNVTFAVIPDPPLKPEWHDRTETQNRYLLSCIDSNCVLKSHSLIPSETEHLLNKLIVSEQFNATKYNYRIAPLGTKAQVLGVYRFWRQHRGLTTLMYATPVRYKEEQAVFPAGRTWLLDRSTNWK
jgi:hypothetical protein